MEKTRKGKLDIQQKSNTSWLVTTIEKFIRTTYTELFPPFMSLNRHKSQQYTTSTSWKPSTETWART